MSVFYHERYCCVLPRYCWIVSKQQHVIVTLVVAPSRDHRSIARQNNVIVIQLRNQLAITT